MLNELLVSELRDTLKVKEARLSKVESECNSLRHECNSLRDAIRMMAEPDSNNRAQYANYSTNCW